MKTCNVHEIVYEDYKGRDKLSCPICESNMEIQRHEKENENLRQTINDLKETCAYVLGELEDYDLPHTKNELMKALAITGCKHCEFQWNITNIPTTGKCPSCGKSV